jgi:hypothetical protein
MPTHHKLLRNHQYIVINQQSKEKRFVCIVHEVILHRLRENTIFSLCTIQNAAAGKPRIKIRVVIH